MQTPITLHTVLVPEPSRPLFGFTFLDTAIHWRILTTKAHAGAARLYAEDCWRYLYSYRQADNGYTKHTFLSRFLSFESNLLRATNMARTKPQAHTNNSVQLSFLDMRLTPEQLSEVDDLKMSAAQAMTALTSAVMSGLSFSFSYNAERKTANAMFADKRPDSAAFGFALSAFSDDCQDALKLLLYKHYNLLNGDWSSVLTKPAPRQNRG